MPFEDIQGHVEAIVDLFDGNRFAACMAIANTANDLSKKSNWCVDGSECIAWAATGSAPVDLDARMERRMRASERRTPYMDDLLGYVYDDSIIGQVHESFDQSVYINSPTFYYGDVKDPAKKARIRILTRMCWYDLKEGYEDGR